MIFEVNSGNQLITFSGQFERLSDIRFSPDGTQLAVAGGIHAGYIQLWNTHTGDRLFSFGANSHAVHDIAFSPDGSRLASVAEPGINLWDTADGHLIWALDPDVLAYSIDYSADGTNLVVGEARGVISLWNPASYERILTINTGDDIVGEVEFLSDGTLLSITQNDVKRWNAIDGELLSVSAQHNTYVRSVDFSPDGQFLATESDQAVKIWAVPDGRIVHNLLGHENNINQVKYSPNGHVLASCDDDGTVRLWDTTTGRQMSVLYSPDTRAGGLAFSPDNNLIATGASNQLKLWDVTNGELVQLFYDEDWVYLEQIVFSQDGDTIVFIPREIMLLDVASREIAETLELSEKDILTVR